MTAQVRHFPPRDRLDWLDATPDSILDRLTDDDRASLLRELVEQAILDGAGPAADAVRERIQ